MIKYLIFNMYYISKCPNGLGNRIYQLIHIMYEAENNKQQINIQQLKNKIKSNERQYDMQLILNIDTIEDNFNNLYLPNNIIKKDSFFPKDLHRITKRKVNLSKYFEISNKYIKPYFNENVNQPLNEKICVIHIRSGDLITNNYGRTHPIYVLPPLVYYTKIIDTYNEDYDTFLLITEPDMKNPVINKLKDYSNKVKIQSLSAEEDYITLLRAQSLVLCWSTFSDTAVYLSPNLKNLFFWNDSHCLSDKSVIPKNINYKSLKLTKPYIERGKWNGFDKNQHKLMLEYKQEDIIFEDN